MNSEQENQINEAYRQAWFPLAIVCAVLVMASWLALKVGNDKSAVIDRQQVEIDSLQNFIVFDETQTEVGKTSKNVK